MPSKSLLESRDEVFKEIKDVGEDVAISSLHLFQGDMDIPSLSFHASLGKHGDEEEEVDEIETVLKKNRYPVPPMNHLLTVFNGLTIFSKIDLCGAYNLLRVKEADEDLNASRTKYGSYEYLVMPFGLTNAPASFQNLVNDIFSDFLAYLDDIVVFSSSEEEHVKHVGSVLQRLRNNNSFAKASKCGILGLCYFK
ncbi:hypothetical protein O181_035993 [Austropuccinia psidii MF-1]|uniref:Reverse transcriptase domain-containing protein n=1 Tax=Austropuccinia psidii MF-1 TaxID=1389203 RepID=A0A9Q3D6J0_9BASI|nr:hypothetical protein [Austropuccinia psidii MF-1]